MTDIKKQILKFYNENKDKGKAYTVKHFEKLGQCSISSVYHYIKSAERDSLSNTTRKPFGDATNLNGNRAGRVVKRASSSASITLLLPPQIRVSENATQGERFLALCREKCGRLSNKFLNHDWVMDHKCSFTYRSNQGSRFRSYFTFDGDTRPPPVIYEEDLIPRLNVWIAFSNNGISEPFIQTYDKKIDKQTYIEKCAKKLLIPYILNNHQDLEKTVLWSDSTTTSDRIGALYDQNGIKYVNKNDNAGNRVRCCSYFWTILKNEVYEDNWIAKDDKELEQRIRDSLDRINIHNVMRIAEDTELRIQEMYHKGFIKETADVKQKYTS